MIFIEKCLKLMTLVFNEVGLANTEEVILCESLIDALTFWCWGFHHVTTSFGINGFTDALLQALVSHQIKRVLILTNLIYISTRNTHLMRKCRTALYLVKGMVISSAALSEDHASWSYSGKGRPALWGQLNPEFATCSSGENQSPVNLTEMVEGELPRIDINYKAGGREIVNNGHTVQVNYAHGSTITINGHQFELKQFHFHSPSENLIEGREFPMEGHFVHADKDGNLAVIAVMFKVGESNAELEKAWVQMPQKVGEKIFLSSPVDAAKLLPANQDYYRFNGSLTTPPCSEGVWWFVMASSDTASEAQIEKFSQTIGHPNNRPIQSINARMIVQ